ncbi:trigger factor [Propionibacteriaceae bacterium Y1923]|uniref:trigger factor n=1 Tax=Aestuariimicrobium sp. Y1814 TaxID=3418742 RepID=UPI003C14DA6C
MPSTLEQLSPTRVKLTIELPFSELKPALDKAYQEIGGQVTVPGFRKGKVPARVIDQRFGRGAVLEQAINSALPEAYASAVEEHKLVPLGQPDVDVTKLEDGDLVEFTAEVDVRPEFDLPDFSAVSAEVPVLEVADTELDDRLETLRQRFATTTEVDRAAAEGDVVTLDLVGKQNGELLDEASANGVTYKLGAGGMLDGLDEAATGLKAGETATFTSTLVGGAHKDEEAEIELTVTKVAEQELPELDDEFAQMVSQFDTVEEMKADLSDAIVRQARLKQATDARDKVLEAVLEQTDFELPEAVVTADFEARQQQINTQLAQAGLTLERYLEEAEEEANNAEDFWATIQKRSLDALRAQVVLDKLADEDEIGVEQEELTQLIFSKAAQSGSTPEQEMQHMMEHNHTQEWMLEVRRNKALTKIVNAAKITDADGKVIDLTKLGQDGNLVNEDAEDEAAEAPAPKKSAAKASAADAPVVPANVKPTKSTKKAKDDEAEDDEA